MVELSDRMEEDRPASREVLFRERASVPRALARLARFLFWPKGTDCRHGGGRSDPLPAGNIRCSRNSNLRGGYQRSTTGVFRFLQCIPIIPYLSLLLESA